MPGLIALDFNAHGYDDGMPVDHYAWLEEFVYRHVARVKGKK